MDTVVRIFGDWPAERASYVLVLLAFVNEAHVRMRLYMSCKMSNEGPAGLYRSQHKSRNQKGKEEKE